MDKELEKSLEVLNKYQEVQALQEKLLREFLETAQTIYKYRSDANTVGSEADHLINLITEMLEK